MNGRDLLQLFLWLLEIKGDLSIFPRKQADENVANAEYGVVCTA